MRTANASLLTAVLLALSSILLLGAPAHAADPLTDESLIIDEADVLDEQLLVEEINSLEGVTSPGRASHEPCPGEVTHYPSQCTSHPVR